MSWKGAIAGPVSQIWYLKDYWRPEYALKSITLLEDLLFAFLLVGLTGAMANIFLRKESVAGEKPDNKLIRYVIAVAIMLGSLFVFTNLLKLNSIYASGIGFVILALLIWRQRPDLIKPSITVALSFLILIGISYNLIFIFWPNMIQNFWFLQNISGIIILNIPLEEFLWFGTWGIIGSVLYEWKKGYYFTKSK
jgi:hypothetical protein